MLSIVISKSFETCYSYSTCYSNFLLLILIKFSVLALASRLKEVFQAKVNYISLNRDSVLNVPWDASYKIVKKLSKIEIHGVAKGILSKSRKRAIRNFLGALLPDSIVLGSVFAMCSCLFLSTG